MKFIKPLIGAATIVTAFTSIASAQSIVHRYDMNIDGTANDSVGTADGTLSAGATIAGGVLTPQDGGNPSGGTGRGVVLPTTAVAGLSGSFSIECWYSWDGTGGYQTLYSFSNGSNANSLVAVAKRQGEANLASQSSAFKWAPDNTETIVQTRTNKNPGAAGGLVLASVVTTYDATTNMASIYLNGAIVSAIDLNNSQPVGSTTGTLAITGFNLSSLTQLGIGGSSPYTDEVVNGTISDFRIYSGALSLSQVANIYSLGADASNSAITAAIPEPSTIALLVGAGVAGLVIRRRSRA
jgi:hypothetical protein